MNEKLDNSVLLDLENSLKNEQINLDKLYDGITHLYNRVTEQDKTILTLEYALKGTLYRISKIKEENDELKNKNRKLLASSRTTPVYKLKI